MNNRSKKYCDKLTRKGAGVKFVCACWILCVLLSSRRLWCGWPFFTGVICLLLFGLSVLLSGAVLAQPPCKRVISQLDKGGLFLLLSGWFYTPANVLKQAKNKADAQALKLLLEDSVLTTGSFGCSSIFKDGSFHNKAVLAVRPKLHQNFFIKCFGRNRSVKDEFTSVPANMVGYVSVNLNLEAVLKSVLHSYREIKKISAMQSGVK